MDKKSWEESFKNFLGQTTDQDLKVDSSKKYTTSEVPLTPENVKRNIVDTNTEINSDNLLIKKSDQTGKFAIDQSQLELNQLYQTQKNSEGPSLL